MSNLYQVAKKCKLSKGFLPSFTPEIYSLSVNNSVAGEYSFVSITGNNFLPNGLFRLHFPYFKSRKLCLNYLHKLFRW